MIYDYFRVTGAHDAVLDYADYSLSLFVMMSKTSIRDGWDEILFSMTKIPSDDILDSV